MHNFKMAMKDWEKDKNLRLLYGSSKKIKASWSKGKETVFISKLDKGYVASFSKYRRVYPITPKIVKTKSEAIAYAKDYMRKY